MIGLKNVTRTLRRAMAIVAVLLATAASGIEPAPGSIDAQFGFSNGVVFTSAGLGFTSGIALAGDGKIVRGVLTNYSTANVYRWYDDGAIDTTFNSTGRSVDVALSNAYSGFVARATAAQPDGKVLFMLQANRTIPGFAESFPSAAAVARFNADGSLDTAFGTNGVAYVEPNTNSESAYYGLTTQADGKILLSGTCSNVACAVRLLANGGRDTGFGVNGIASHTAASTFPTVSSITTLPDGRVVLGGVCSPVGQGISGLCIWRFTATGGTDTSFNFNGLARIYIPGTTGAFGGHLAVGPDGSVLVAGGCSTASVNVACMARTDAFGALETTFNLDGTAASLYSGYNLADVRVALQSDGRIQLGMTCTPTGTNSGAICLFRYNNDGFLDQSYGSAGRVISNYTNGAGAYDAMNSITLQPDGKLLVGATCFNNALANRPCIARYFGGPMASRMCSMDIDGDGRVTGTVDSLIHARVALGLTGNGVVGGITFPAVAKRKTWPAIREFLVMQCGMSLIP